MADQMAKCPHCGKWSTVRYCATMRTWAWLYSGEYCPECDRFYDVNLLPRRAALRPVEEPPCD